MPTTKFNSTSQISQSRLRVAVADFGWGPKEGQIEFHYNDQGWILGNGIVVTPWDVLRVPLDAEIAMRDIEAHCNEIREEAGLSPLSGKRP